jgi:hypothetical protein
LEVDVEEVEGMVEEWSWVEEVDDDELGFGK